MTGFYMKRKTGLKWSKYTDIAALTADFVYFKTKTLKAVA